MKKRSIGVAAFLVAIFSHFLQFALTPEPTISGPHLSGPLSLPVWLIVGQRGVIIAFMAGAILGPIIALILILMKKNSGYIFWWAAVICSTFLGRGMVHQQEAIQNLVLWISIFIQLPLLFWFRKASDW